MSPFDKARLDVMLLSPWLSRCLLGLPVEETRAVPTMATDGRRLLVNPAFVETLTVAEISGVLVHECLHVLAGHHLRRGSRDPVRWNIAADYAINPIVADAGYSLPAGALVDTRFADMCAEQIYADLPTAGRPPPTQCGIGDVIDGDSSSDAIADWKALVHETRSYGVLPAGLERLLPPRPVPPSLSLAEAIADWLAEVRTDERSFARPSRWGDLPGETLRRDGSIAVCIDTSGSMPDAVVREMLDIVLTSGCSTVRLIYADAAVQADVECHSAADLLAVPPKGGGGTDFRPAIALADGASPDAIVYCTDGDGAYPSALPVAPVLWVLTDDAQPPWGRVVRLP